jgi:hypothetical protein
MEAFNKILEMGMTKACFKNHNDWDEWVSFVLWAYQTTTKILNRYTMFQLVYGQEAVMQDKFLTPILFIVQATKMTDYESIAE